MLHNLINNNNDSILILAYSQKTPFISHITQTLVKDIGDEAEMACSTIYSKEFNVLWVKVTKYRIDESIVLSSGSTVIVNDPRVTLMSEINPDSSRHVLQVTKVMKKKL